MSDYYDEGTGSGDYYDVPQYDDNSYQQNPDWSSNYTDMSQFDPNRDWLSQAQLGSFDSLFPQIPSFNPDFNVGQLVNAGSFDGGYIPQDTAMESFLSQAGGAPRFDMASIMQGGGSSFQPSDMSFNPSSIASDSFTRAAMNEMEKTASAPSFNISDAIKSGEMVDLGGGLVSYSGMTMPAETAEKLMVQRSQAPIEGGIDPRARSGEGFKGSIVHALPGNLGVRDDGNGLATGIIDKKGVLGGDGWGNAGTGLMREGAPGVPMSLADAIDPNLFEKNKDLSWSEFAKPNGYDQYDTGTDLQALIGGKLASMGLGGLGGNGKNVASAAPALAQRAATVAAEKLNPTQKAGITSTPADKDGNGGAMGGLNMAAMLAALLGGGDKKAPKSLQGDKNATYTEMSKKAGSGRKKKASGGLLQMAHGGRMAGGQDDVIPIDAAPGEYVMDAESVSALGDGSTEAGAAKLDAMRQNLRKHKRTGALSQIPPKAKSVDKYINGAR